MKLQLVLITLFTVFFSVAQNPDIVGYHELSINGINSSSTEMDLISVFGKPNLITEPNYACGPLSPEWNEVYVKLYRWDGIHFHMVDGKLEIGKIDFRKVNPKVKTRQLTFDKNTTLDELKNAYPNSYLNWKEKNEKYNSKVFSVWPSEFSDSEFHIIIENERIVEFRLFHPC